MNGTIATRTVAWFAAGVVAALLSALVFTQAWNVDAAPGDEDSTFVPIEPCRLFDIRPAPFTVGSRTSPLGPDESYPVQVTGTNGGCTIPNDAVGVAMNVTVTGATQNTFVSVVPSDVTGEPSSSSLNTTVGAAAIPNKVDVRLGADGKIRVFNKFGSVFVVADVVGYYTSSTLTELSSTLTEHSSTLTEHSSTLTELVETRPFARHVSGNQSVSVDTTAQIVRSISITAPIAGTVIVQSTNGATINAGEAAICSITDGDQTDSSYNQIEEDHRATMAGARAFPVGADETLTANLVCRAETTPVAIFDSTMTATFYAEPIDTVAPGAPAAAAAPPAQAQIEEG